MFGFIARKYQQAGTRIAEREIREFISRLSALDSSSVAGVVAMAADIKNAYKKDGYNMGDPIVLTGLHPSFLVEHGKTIRKAQEGGNLPVASGMLVWHHTLRAACFLDLRQLGRDLWRELARGMPYVEDAAQGYEALTGRRLNIDGSNEFPIGFTPDRL